MKKLVSLVALVMVACVNGSFEDDFTIHEEVDVPGVPVQEKGEVSVSKIFDVGDFIHQMKKMGNVEVSLNENYLTTDTDFGFLQHLTLVMESANGNFPARTVADMPVISTNNRVDIPLNIDSDALANALESGQVKFTFTLDGSIPQNNTTLQHTLSLHVKADVSKSVSDIGK